ncbi:phage terminase large subunit [Sphingobacterium spiritivorum]|uniref:Phage terminase, large subunit, PBSX family n=1 Tax=Sphingobacterium spiritivorum ATCC 33861 TaxID=525373 RepID=D7VN40_SPHSI|nr:phage terminase large subunit [Sphingobacterium spiritivorum]EFK57337.1 phage terminase, large subunit, PBSX family [Sphingobacterium spiritivorum ATCC 33861]QQT36583.1 phage terminase large subunit [Sphingobacterium spiritivorum]WQD33334.1 phage terminase large subunit [Sphingobacterium spiritivorum]SUJ22161.1 phage terminase, large subunit, PBSX family [Sphingobacterium spiritivorum]
MVVVKDKFQPIYTDKDHFIILVTGGRGSGKSFEVSTFVTRLTFEAGHKVLYSRYTMKSADISVIPEIKGKIDLDGVSQHFTVKSEDIVNEYSKSEIMFRGIKTSSGNQTANLKSIEGLTTFVGDEMEEWQSEDDYDKLILSIRKKGIQNRVILIMNPSDDEHFVYKKYIQDTHRVEVIDGVEVQISTHPNVLHIHTSYLDNIENVSETFLAEIAEIKRKSEKQAHQAAIAEFPEVHSEEYKRAYHRAFQRTKYAYVVIGRWADIAEGVIFTDWEEGDFDESLPYLYGQDYGFSIDPTTLVKVAVDERRKRVYVQEKFYSKSQLKLQNVYNMNLAYLDYPNDLIIGDSAEDRLIADLAGLGLNIEECDKGPGSVKAGIADLQDYTIVVSPDSPNIKRELKTYVWSDKKANIPVDSNNHTIDPIRYAKRRHKKGINGFDDSVIGMFG